MIPETGAPILVIKKPYIDMIISGQKTLEIRGAPCRKPVGTRVFLSASGSGTICGSAIFSGSVGPISLEDWDAYRAMHRVEGNELMYKKTFGWSFVQAEVVDPPIPYMVKRGSIGWRRYEPPL